MLSPLPLQSRRSAHDEILPVKTFHLHLISDATGETIKTMARACLAQFEDLAPVEHVWTLIRTPGQMERVLAALDAEPGVIMYTVVDFELGRILEHRCRERQYPCISVLQPVLSALSALLGARTIAEPGRQHILDAEYFRRMEAVNFVLNHDDGQLVQDIEKADIVLIGVSRTSKTPTCIYLANRGIKAANVPLVLDVPPPEALLKAKRPLVVGLTEDPERLVQLRRNRLQMLNETRESEYVDHERVVAELTYARRLCQQSNWPVIDVTRRSIEETAAAILQIYDRRQGRIA